MKRHGLSSLPPPIWQSSVFFIKARDSQPAAHGLDVKSGYPEDLLGNSTPLLVTGPPSADATLPGSFSHETVCAKLCAFHTENEHLEWPRLESSGHGH